MKVLPVVHTQSVEQSVDQARAAFELGADGIFLIDHGVVGRAGLLQVYEATRRVFSDSFIGLNFLSGGPAASWEILANALRAGTIGSAPDAVWVDDVHAGGSLDEDLGARRRLAEDTPELGAVLLYGGVAFKYTSAYTEDPETAARAVAETLPYLDVPTTSGPGTGSAPTPAKLAAMKRVVGAQPLAVASGISSENLADYGGTIDEILVASSVETSKYSGVFELGKLKAMIDAAHS